MINLDLGVSPIQSCYMENIPNLFIKREDCLPFSFGGNKLRICLEFLKDMQTQQKNCMIGYGSLSSNLCRVLANLCSYYGIKCFIVYAVDDEKVYTIEGNTSDMCAKRSYPLNSLYIVGYGTPQYPEFIGEPEVFEPGNPDSGIGLPTQ